MQIQIRTDNNISVNDNRAVELKKIVTHAMRHCGSHITRIEMHLSDVNGTKAGENDKCCVMEARLERRKPMAATEEANTVAESVRGAADKLARMVKSTRERAADKRPPTPDVDESNLLESDPEE
ncbi:MAG: HPF/RaiA family ribosome-associated protein [Granulosicoccus sp.]